MFGSLGGSLEGNRGKEVINSLSGGGGGEMTIGPPMYVGGGKTWRAIKNVVIVSL